MDLVYTILRRLNAEDIRETGEGYECQCPFHEAHKAKRYFRVNASTGDFICHFSECGVRGRLVTLIRKAYGCSKNEAKEIAVNAQMYIERWEEHEPDIEEVGPEDWIPYRGTVPDYLLRRGFTAEALRHHRIGFNRRTNQIIAPTMDAKGNLVGVSRRYANDGQPFIHNRGFKRANHLFGLDLAMKEPHSYPCIVVEGQLDPLGVYPIKACVATFGASLSKTQAELLVKHFKEVWLMYDNDLSGYKGTWRAISKLRKAGSTRLRIVSYNEEDPGERARTPLDDRKMELLMPAEWKASFRHVYPEHARKLIEQQRKEERYGAKRNSRNAAIQGKGR